MGMSSTPPQENPPRPEMHEQQSRRPPPQEVREMEKAMEELERNRKRDRSHPDVEDSGAWMLRRETEHAESWKQVYLPASSWDSALVAALSEEEEDEEEEEDDDDEFDDDPDREALRFRKSWNSLWSGYFGSFEDTTIIPPMRYTDERPLDEIYPCSSLQIFSAKIAGISGGFQWPLDVFGLVSIRDSVDQNRNIIFQRSRVDCQTITEKDPYLVLTGPTRAVVLSDPVTMEVYLKVKGPTEREDKTLCFLARKILHSNPVLSCLLHQEWTSKFSTMGFTLGHIIFSVEATISVRVVGGSWPDGFHGQFAAFTSSICHDCDDEVPVVGGTTSVNGKEVVLLRFGDEKGPVIGDGVIELSRRVVSAESESKLKVFVKAWQDGDNVVQDVEEFLAKKAGRSFGTLQIGSCKMDVIVAWSLISNDPEPY